MSKLDSLAHHFALLSIVLAEELIDVQHGNRNKPLPPFPYSSLLESPCDASLRLLRARS